MLHIFFVIEQVFVHVTILYRSLFIVNWLCFIEYSFHNIVNHELQDIVHSGNCSIVHNFEQFALTLRDIG